MRSRRTMLLALVTLVVLAAPGAAERRPPRTELTILTGPEGSTYHVMAKDVERLLEEVVGELAIDLDVVPSQGGLQNLIDVFTYHTVSLAISQQDLITYFRYHAKSDDRARQVVEAVQLVLPLHEEEVHVIARRTVARLADLAGKRVSIGEPGSGTSVTARVLLRLTRVEPQKVLNLELPRAIEALRRGEIDALIFVSGAPSAALSERITAEDRFVFLPVVPEAARANEVARVYRKGSIPAGAYPGQSGAVETVTVRSAIGTAGPVNCEALGRLARAVVDHLPWLREHGHPKWKSVDFDVATLLAQPRLSPCVASALRR